MSVRKKFQIVQRLELPPLPIGNRFTAHVGVDQRFPTSLSVDGGTGLMFLDTTVPELELVSHHAWLTYNEPEHHLDDLVASLIERYKLGRDTVIGGVSWKDDSTLARFAREGMKTWRIQPERDLGITSPSPGSESVQRELSVEKAEAVLRHNDKCDLLIVRHLLEHAYRADDFLSALRCLVKDGGKIVFEVPDCEIAFGSYDYTFIWEEHLYYFTSQSLGAFLNLLGSSIESLRIVPHPFERLLIAIVGVEQSASMPRPTLPEVDVEILRAKRFLQSFPLLHAVYKEKFEKLRRLGRVAVLGAGHRTSTFLALFQLADYIDFMVDDNPSKKDLILPGTKVRIMSSEQLRGMELGACVLGTSQMSEESIVERLKGYFQSRPVTICSIFASSPRSLLDLKYINGELDQHASCRICTTRHNV